MPNQGYGGGGYGGHAGGAPIPPGPQGTEVQRIMRASEKAAERQAPPPYEQWRPITLANVGDRAYMETEEGIVKMITVQVFTGTLDIWKGDLRGGPAPGIPYWRIGAIGVPVHIPLVTKSEREFTFFANQAGTTASVLLHSPT